MAQLGKPGTAGEYAGDGALTFEEKTYAYARHWAKSTRRGFLRIAAAGLSGGALAGLTGMPEALAQRRGGTISIARGQESDTLDPHKTALLVAHEIAW